MNREQWLEVKAIAADALAMPAAERPAYVAARCGPDEPTFREVLSLLESASEAAGLYETPRLTTAAPLLSLVEADAGNPVAGGRIGAYRIVAEIGRGGMGAAYLAERADEAYEKRVAIKLIKRGMDTDAILLRFRHERQILANLEHPNIVMLLDGGTSDDGRPYFVMEYVDGVPIDAYCRDRELSIPERLQLFLAVCAGVQHAHEKHVVHRDLKPSNILVTAKGVPKLLDFGIARLFDAPDRAQTREPTVLALAMTTRYASPEQVSGAPVTPASDVYSLGVILYELVAGRSPYVIDGRSTREIERSVCEERPQAPSRIGDNDRRGLPAGYAGLRRRAARELDAIILTSLEKKPSDRYASARALAADIRRWLERRPIAARPRRVRAGAARRSVLAGAALAGAALLFVAADRFVDSDAAVEPQSLAVLPFTNVGGDPDLEFLVDGLAEDIIHRLSRVPNVRVIARDSAYRHKGVPLDPERVGRELDVRTVLAGRIVERGSRLFVTAELIDTRDSRQIWGERYELAAEDMQRLHSRLARQIATSLELKLPGEDAAYVYRPYTSDPAAYEAYLKGRYFWNKRTPAAFRTSVAYYHRAIDLDPRFALAYVGLADSYALLTEYHALAAVETYPLARDAVMQALAIDPGLAEARASLAYMHQFYEWDFEAADREYRRALDLNPNYATGRQWYAEYLLATGRFAEAKAEIRKALTVDPLSLIINAVEANILYVAGDYERAIARAHEVVAMDPNFPEIYEYLKRSYDRTGEYREAVTARQTRRRLLGLNAEETPALTEAAAAESATLYWQKRVEQELEESQAEGFLPFEFAELYAQAGHTGHALDWLERACRDHDFLMVYASVAPNLEPLRGEPRYREIIERGCAVGNVRLTAR